MSSFPLLLPLVLLFGCLIYGTTSQVSYGGCSPSSAYRQTCARSCLSLEPKINRSITQAYEVSPLYVNFQVDTEDARQTDNICFTFFPTADDPDKYILYTSRVYLNNTNKLFSFLITQNQLGTYQLATPGCTFNDTVIGCNPCTTAINYRCYASSDCPNRLSEIGDFPVFGLSTTYQRMTPSCLQQAVWVTLANGIPPQNYYVMPMRLPPRCVIRQPCAKYTNAD